MKQTILSVVCLMLAFGLVAVACGGAADTETKTADEPAIEYPQAEEGKTTEVGVDGYFEITLDDDTSGELRWLFVEPPDETLLKIVSETFNGPEGEEGGPGKRVWLFQAIADGETEFTIEFLRPWEEDVEPAKSPTFKIVIAPAPEEEDAPKE